MIKEYAHSNWEWGTIQANVSGFKMKKVCCQKCGSTVLSMRLEKHLQRHKKDKLCPVITVTCIACGVTGLSEYGSDKFCTRKCSRSYSTKNRRQEINEKLRTASLKKRICVICRKNFPKSKRRRGGVLKCAECHEKGAPERRAAALAKISVTARKTALRRISMGERWFGTQTSYDFRGQTVECDSYLEKSCLMMIDKEWPDVIGVSRCDFWLPYGMPGEIGDPRRYNPDFIVSLLNRKVIVEVKSERMGKSDTWEDYREKSIVKQQVLEDYAKNIGYEVFWCTQRVCKKYYSKVLSDPDRPVKVRKPD